MVHSLVLGAEHRVSMNTMHYFIHHDDSHVEDAFYTGSRRLTIVTRAGEGDETAQMGLETVSR